MATCLQSLNGCNVANLGLLERSPIEHEARKQMKSYQAGK